MSDIDYKGKCRCGVCNAIVPVGRPSKAEDGFGKKISVWRHPKVHKHNGERCPGSDRDALPPPGAPFTWVP